MRILRESDSGKQMSGVNKEKKPLDDCWKGMAKSDIFFCMWKMTFVHV